MGQTNRKDIGYLGEEFQFRLIHHFMENKDCFKDLSSIIDQNMFTNPTLKLFVGLMKEHYERFEAVPSYDMMGIALRDKARSETDSEIYLATLDKIFHTEEDSVEYINELALKFFKQQNIVKTANEILRIAGNGDTSQYERCVELLNDALHQGSHDELGVNVFEDIGETLSDDYRVPIPTGISHIDDVLEGGLGKGELGVIIGPTSFGKTSLTTAMASYASTFACPQNNNEGFKVLQIVFEDRVKQIQRKHLARIVTQTSNQEVEAKDLSKPSYINLVKETVDKYPYKDMLKKNLKIVRLPNGEVTATKIKHLLKKLINSGFKPDMMVVDYFECLDVSDVVDNKNGNEYEMQGKVMRRFESMAGEFDIAIWIPSQGNKDSINAELVTMDKMGGSVKKAQIAHIIMSIARTVEDIEFSKATIAILKNRAGQSGKVFNNVKFNNGTCIIECDDSSSGIDMISFNQNKQKENFEVAKMLAQRIKEKKS